MPEPIAFVSHSGVLTVAILDWLHERRALVELALRERMRRAAWWN
jgi:hypothetical protein